MTIEVTPGSAADGVVAVDVRSHLRLVPGRYELRVASASGNLTGNLFTDVEVPEITKGALSLSSLVLEMPAATMAARAASVALAEAVPTVRRTFTTADGVTAFLRVYQGGKGTLVPTAIAARVEDAMGTRVLDERRDLASSQFANRAADDRLTLPLARLAAGDYLLTIEASMGKTTTSRVVRFSRE